MLPLDGTWKIADFDPGAGVTAGAHAPGFDDASWIDAEVPGDVHTALLAAGRIEDPFVAQNIEKCAWVEDREWWYRAEFQAPPLASGERADLVFEGLDTFATVYVNGVEIGSVQRTCSSLTGSTPQGDPGGPQRGSGATGFDGGHRRGLDSSPFWAAYTPRVWVRSGRHELRMGSGLAW